MDVPTGIADCVPGTWATATIGPSARYRHGGVSDGTYIYVFGGGTSTGGVLERSLAMGSSDPDLDAISQHANRQTEYPRGLLEWENIRAGRFHRLSHITENAIYDIATNTWSTGAPLPAAQTGTNVAFNNKIYNFGGNPGPQATVTIYDIASNTWSTGASMPVATTYGRSIVAGSFAYYIGGIAAATTNAVHRYDFAANSWTTVAPLQTARTSAEVMISPDGLKLFAVMGGDSTFFTGVPLAVSVEIYNIAVNSWSYGNPVVNKAAGPAGGLAGGKAMVQGGVDNTIYYDAVQVSPVVCGLAVTSTVPAVGSVVSTQPTDFVVNLSNPVQPATVQASDFTVNGTPANSFILNGAQITFHFNSTPVIAQGLQTMHIAAGAFLRDPDGSPVNEFTGTFRYDATLLAVTTTVPPVGGTFTPPAPGSYQYDVNWNEAVDPASVSTTDLTLGGTSGGNVTGVTVINANMTTRFTLNLPFGGTLTANIAAGAITDAFGNLGAAFSGNYTVQGCPPQDHYTIAQIGGSIVPGTTDIGNHGDDLVTTVALPFTYSLYGTNYTSINVSSNGNAQFTTTDTAFTNVCPLPWTTHNSTIFPYWDDQRTDAQTAARVPGGVCGIFTSVSGTAPNRIFNIEWRTVYFSGGGTAATTS